LKLTNDPVMGYAAQTYQRASIRRIVARSPEHNQP
jgi:hypothetical protein